MFYQMFPSCSPPSAPAEKGSMYMKYALNEKKKSSRAHIWDEEKQDTKCRMYSTGGLKKKRIVVDDNPQGRLICQLCSSVGHEKSKPVGHVRIDINCPYHEHKAAKSLGAKWDYKARTWYLMDVEDLTPFMKWIDRPTEISARSTENSAQPQIEDRVSFNSMTPPQNLGAAAKISAHPHNLCTSKMPSKLSASRSTHDVESSQCDSQDKGKISCICQVEPWEDCEHTEELAHKAFLEMSTQNVSYAL